MRERWARSVLVCGASGSQAVVCWRRKKCARLLRMKVAGLAPLPKHAHKNALIFSNDVRGNVQKSRRQQVRCTVIEVQADSSS